MKKVLFSMLAVAAIASCAKTEPTFTEVDSEIKIAPVTSVATKANVNQVIDGTTYPAAENFDVFAYWVNNGTKQADYLIDENTKAGVEFVNKGNYWGGKTTYYWPKNGALQFAAYSPSSLDMIHDYAADTYRLDNFVYPAANTTVDDYTANTFDVLVAPTSEPYTAETGASKVAVKFEHALSWVTFKLQSTEVAVGAFTVNDVVVNDVAKKGTLLANMKADKVWQDLDSKSAVKVGLNNNTPYTVTADAVAQEAVANGLLFIPQAPTTVTIYYTQNELSHKDAEGNKVVDSPALADQVITVPLVLDNAADVWEPGKHYTYTVLFDLDEILINPSVEDWVETTEVIVNSDPVKVTTSEQLVTAIAEGKDVVLEDDITLDEPVVVEPVVATRAATAFEVTIDLNGKDIIAPSSDAIVVDGGAHLTINGNGKVHAATDNATSANAVWVKHGNVTINGGDYFVGKDNNLRNDCIYVGAYAYKDNAAEYESHLVINGGTFAAEVSPEDGKCWVLNLKDEFYRANSTIKVYGGTFKSFDPAAGGTENPAANFVAEGYGSYELETGVWTVASKTAPIEVATEAALWDAAEQGANVVLAADIELSGCVDVTANVTIDLNGKTLKVPATSTASYKDVFFVTGDSNFTINGEGEVIAEDGYPVWAAGNSVVELNGGYYFSPVTCVYAQKNSVVTINGGTYEVDGTNNPDGDYGQVYTLNKKDGTAATITVKGGTYYNFNPAESLSENPQTNFVADGYKVLVDGDWYNVVAE